MARVLAVDFGERRIGLALSDPSATIAQPLGTLDRRRGKRPPIAKILDTVERRNVDRIVVGLPLALDASETEWTTEVRAFAGKLAARTGRPVYLLDERLTSVMAERAIRSIGLPRGEREKKARVDAAAATILLQKFLDRDRLGVAHEAAVLPPPADSSDPSDSPDSPGSPDESGPGDSSGSSVPADSSYSPDPAGSGPPGPTERGRSR